MLAPSLQCALGLGITSSSDPHIGTEGDGYVCFDYDPFLVVTGGTASTRTIIIYKQSHNKVVKCLLLGDMAYSLLLREREKERNGYSH